MKFNQSHGIVMVSLLGDIYELFLIFSTFYLNATKNTRGWSETTEKVGGVNANLQNPMKILGLCPIIKFILRFLG